ncbi:hypothetical protein GCM10025876_07490 [Demequina litorisediminis]|uniref:Acetolactate synthase n=1 Tax=Demequina litorisediminis TaxID=1849022 RepID=A0ABQ6IB29_9MICO|nr:hypothetical protein GCM10025876_07490 [Demequina litorisediminis]
MAQVRAPKPSALATPQPARTSAGGSAASVSGQEMTGAQAIIKSLEMAGATDVFGLPGGAILPTYDPLMDSTTLRHILVRHEQGAGHAAQGYAHATGRPGVCIATSGPGATNLVTPIADANMDSIPMVAITGQVAASLIGTDGFQEADIVGITQPITKHNVLVTDPNEIPQAIAEAFYIATHGRPGPVLVDIAKSAQQATMNFQWPERIELPGFNSGARPHAKTVQEAARLLATARRPVLYVGGGVIRSGASAGLRKLTDLSGAAVVTTLMARGALPDSHPQHLGMPGMHGTVAAVAALQKADLVVALGARFDDRVTGKLSSFAPHATIVHADIDPAEIGKNRAVDVPIVGDLKEVFEALVPALAQEHQQHGKPDLEAWWAQARRLALDLRPRVHAYRRRAVQPPARDSAPRRDLRTGVDLHLRRGPAPDVGQPVHQVRAPQLVDQLGRPGHHGLLGACGHGRQGRRTRSHRVGHRRRRLLPDDQPGASSPAPSTRSPSRWRSSTTRRWAWCASGRPCSTTSATRTPTCTRATAPSASPTS